MDGHTPMMERIAALHPKKIDLSLGRIEQLLAKLSHPERKLPPVLHVAGTNGKGSVGAMLRAMLEADGKRVHAYSSPHLVRFNERIRLGANGGGTLISDEAFEDALSRAEIANDGAEITVFEITTVAALLAFSEKPADALVLEVGLGGRLDATNVIEKPAVSVITSISFDHMDYLGDTLGEIAMEKAGIMKRGRPAVSAPQRSEVEDALARCARSVGAPLKAGNQDWTISAEHGRLAYQDERGLIDLPLPRLLGRHQHVNAGTAVAALRETGLIADPSSYEVGLAAVDWPGRMQRLTKGRLMADLPFGAELWIDGGHNPDAAEAVAAAFGDLEERVSRPLFLIAGMLTTKDPVGYLRPFAGLARHTFTLRVPGTQSSFEPGALAEKADEAGLSAEPVGSVRTALRLLGENWRFEPPPRILICGSLHLVGDVLAQNDTPPQ